MDPILIYFSSTTENTKFFVETLGFRNGRIPLRRESTPLELAEPYILVTPTYGAGIGEEAIPPQVRRFLSNPKHRELCVGVIGGGNRNFGAKFAAAGLVVSQRLGIPLLYRFELRGTETDRESVRTGVSESWATLLKLRREK